MFFEPHGKSLEASATDVRGAGHDAIGVRTEVTRFSIVRRSPHQGTAV
jgi:hypothetical protein